VTLWAVCHGPGKSQAFLIYTAQDRQPEPNTGALGRDPGCNQQGESEVLYGDFSRVSDVPQKAGCKKQALSMWCGLYQTEKVEKG